MAGVDELNAHIEKLKSLVLSDKIDRAVLTTVHAKIAERIFVKGQDARGTQIGTYSASYQKQRAKKNWPASSKVILQATRQMANDFSFIKIADGQYGSGFQNPESSVKRKAVERTYKKEIFAISDNEEKEIKTLYEQALRNGIK